MADYLDDIKNYKRLVESVAIIESYQDRVDTVVNEIVRHLNGVATSKDDVKRAMNTVIGYLDIPQMRAVDPNGNPSTGRKDFLKDVIHGLKGKITIKKSRPTVAKVSAKDKIAKLSELIQAAVGDAFPDGDPLDAILIKASKYGLNDDFVHTQQNLDKAAKLLGAKSYNDYLADMYDDVKADNPNFPGLPDSNPWRH